MKALFVVDDCGLGHYVRCGALAAELERRGASTYTIGPRDTAPQWTFNVVVIDMRSYMPPVPGIPYTVRIIDEPAQQGPCDLMVLGSAGVGEAAFVSAAAGRVLLGPRYSLLRPEFVAEQGIVRDRDGVLDIRKVAGWSAADFAEQIASAKVVVTYAGMRAMEAACVSTPAVLIPRNRGESMNATRLVEAGAAVRSTEDEAEGVARRLLDLPELLDRMSLATRGLVDGLGCARVADEIQGLFR